VSQEPLIDEILVECRRIGFGIAEFGGITVTGDGDRALADFRDFLRTIPNDAGYDEYLRRSRAGWEPSDEQLRAEADPELLEDVRVLVGRELRAVTWAERARWLRLAADQIERSKATWGELWTRCSFCGSRREEAHVIGGPRGIGICRACALVAVEASSHNPDSAAQAT